MKNKLIALLLFVAFCMTMPLPVLGAGVLDSGQWEYVDENDINHTIKYSLSTDGVLTVDATKPGATVGYTISQEEEDGTHTEINWGYFNYDLQNTYPHEPSYKYSSRIKTLIITSNIANIDLSAFQNIPNLQEISFPETLKTIYGSAFRYCSGLISVELPASLLHLYPFAFDDCTALTTVTFKGEKTQIGLNQYSFPAFENTPALKDIYLPSSPPFITPHVAGTKRTTVVNVHYNAKDSVSVAYVNAAKNDPSYINYNFVIADSVAPAISSVTVPTSWGTNAAITVNATDNKGVTGYAVTTTASQPSSGWQASSSFTLAENGTYYAWARDDADNVSSRPFTVSTIDKAAPSVNSVSEQVSWGTSSAVTINATDVGSGVASYAVTTTNTAPASGWQSSNAFTLYSNSTFYAWSKDAVGHVSAGHSFSVTKIDGAAPTVDSVTVPTTWGTTNTVTLHASDVGVGVTSYAVTTGSAAPSSGWQNDSSFTLSANGTYYAWGKDGAGNVSSGKSFVVNRIDNVAPVVDTVTIPTVWGSTNVVALNASDTGVGVVGYAVTTSYTTPSSWQSDSSFTLFANGTYYAWSKDGAGNVSSGKSFVVNRIDSFNPVVDSVTVPTVWGMTNSVTLNASDMGVGVESYVVTTANAAPAAGWQSSNTFTLSTNGTYYAWSKDWLGNVSSSRSFYVSKIDATAPTVSNVSVPNSWNSSSTVTVSATDGASGMAAYAVTTTNAAPAFGWQSGNSFTLTANGTYYAWGKDTVGNVSAGRSFAVSRIDTTAPTVSSVTVPTVWAQKNDVIIHATDSGSGLSAYAVTSSSSIPGTGWQTAAQFSLTANGTYYAWAKDTVGNVSLASSFTVTRVDTTPPVVSSITLPITWGSQNDITINATDNASGVTAYAVTTSTSAPYTGWQPSAQFMLTTKGTYYAWSRDAAGNVSVGNSFAIDKVDNAAPTISAVVVPTAWCRLGTATILAEDDGSGVFEYAITTTTAMGQAVWQQNPSIPLTANGNYYAWAKDNAGNVSPPRYFSVTKIDAEPPEIESAFLPDGWMNSAAVTIKGFDKGSGIVGYAVTETDVAPNDGWQDTAKFPLTRNGSYYAWMQDGAGNISISKPFTLDKLDTEPPVMETVTLPTAWFATGELILLAKDALSGVDSYAITTTNSAPTTGWQQSAVFQVTANGSYYAWSKDKAGNHSQAKPFVVDLQDKQRPILSQVEVPTAWCTSGSITILGEDSDSGIAEYAISAQSVLPQEGWQASPKFPATENGSFYAWARDAAGNNSFGKYFTVTKLDRTAPVVTTATAASTWGAQSQITIEATDVGSGVSQYALTTADTAPDTGWQTSNKLTVSGNGRYYAWARDSVGHRSLSKEVVVARVDDLAPVIVTVTPSTTWSRSNTAVVTATDSESGLSEYAVTTEATAPDTGWQTKNSFTITANGSYYAWARDKSGNSSEGKSFTIAFVDLDNPLITKILTPESWSPSAKISIEAGDATSPVVAYALSSGGTAPPSFGWQSKADFICASNGEQFAWAKDAAGNVSAPVSFQLGTVDTQSPTIEAVELPEGWFPQIEAIIKATDTGSGIASYAITKESKAPTEGWQESNKFPISENGSFYAWAQDKAGNISQPKQFKVNRLDEHAPIVTEISVPDQWDQSNTAVLTATDADGEIALYAVTTADKVPDGGWQTKNSFVFTKNGSFYAWAQDKAGNCSKGKAFVIAFADSDQPVVSKVNRPESWSPSAKISIEAGDATSPVVAYALSSGGTAPPSFGWQSKADFICASNGEQFAWAKDAAGNVSAPVSFQLGTVDTQSPTIEAVELPEGWFPQIEAIIKATDTGSGIASYAITKESKAPTEGWQESNKFPLSENGSYYAWAKDKAGNNTQGKYVQVSRIDAIAPELTAARFNITNTVLTLQATDKGSGVAAIYIDGVANESGYLQYDIPEGTRYLKLKVQDRAKNEAAEQTVRVPGWFDVLGTLTLEPVVFTPDGKTAAVTAKSTGAAVAGIHINGSLKPGNPVSYSIPTGTQYLELQAQNEEGDRSALYRVRVPGWSTELSTIAITGVDFAPDNSSVTVTATETAGHGIAGIYVNDVFFEGSPITYPIPPNTRHVKLQAEDKNGDRSVVLIRRVPGWSEIITTLAITDVSFTDYNTAATITALATGGDSVSGIFVNDQFVEGNPVIYPIPRGTKSLKLQAANPNGDLSAVVNKSVPRSNEKSTLKVAIEKPGWTSASRAKVKIIATDKSPIVSLMARTAEEDEWTDITSSRYITITENTTVYVTAENENGDTKETEAELLCFDSIPPQASATQAGQVVNIRASDNESGLAAIVVNNKEYRGSAIAGDRLAYSIPAGTSSVVVKALDAAGNLSAPVELGVTISVSAVPMVVTPQAPPTPTPPTEAPEAALPSPEPEPEPLPEPEPIPEPEPEQPPAAAASTALSTLQKALLATGLVAAALFSWWFWWYQKKRKEETDPALELEGKHLLYDESEYHGSEDPLDNVTQVDFQQKAS